MTRTPEQKAVLKEKAAEETKKLLIIAGYLYLVLTAMEIYKSTILGEPPIATFKLGYNALEALLFAKVVLIGDLLHLGERFRGMPAIVPTLAKSLSFAVFMAAFSMLEVLVEKLFHGASFDVAAHAVVALDRGVIASHVALMFLNFIPLFAAWEAEKVIGAQRFADLFLKRPAAN